MLCTGSYAKESTPTPPPSVDTTADASEEASSVVWHPFGELVVEGLVGESDNARMIRMLLFVVVVVVYHPSHTYTHENNTHHRVREKSFKSL